MKDNLKKIIFDKKILIVIILILIIILGINYFVSESKIKKANIEGYMFLEKISKCDIIYNIDITTKKVRTEFDKKCFEDATSYLSNIPFIPGEIGEKFLLESEEYLYCSYVNDIKGSEEYKNCVKGILPKIREKYPEVIKE